ncbi:SCP2 sterol-binding domain-containing protein [Motiliproteus sp. MSK22-1]|uniref:SCP2 sterol-binding domain-containing protein n=1 Tax=Motiliproteus sp. MSK22-1 TaxID=1897630 RepID=UPI0009780214|nr:SCP2 sterol-binding domain-containing protein [Motiliproteus sp. MSK22-1]OMH33604.1 SCP-2 family sterol carrier protein [Motiliproteus sp. MSK22-1]
MKSVVEVMNKLVSKFQADAAGDMEAVFQINIEDDQPYYVSISNGECEVSEGEHPDPEVTLIMDSETFVDIISGDLGGTFAFMSGRLRAEGDVILATRLTSLFKR